MAIAFDKTFDNIHSDTGATAVATVPAGGVAQGNLVVLCIGHNAGGSVSNPPTIADSRGNTYTQVGSTRTGSTQNDVRSMIYYSILTTALQQNDTITVTFSASVYSLRFICASAYSGIAQSTPLDDQSSGTDDAFPQSQPTGLGVTTTAANTVLVSFVLTQNVRTITPTSGWTRRDDAGWAQDCNGEVEDKIVTSTGSYSSSPSLSSDDYWNKHTVAFKSGVTVDNVLPDADLTTTGWTTAPLFSKVNDSSDATVIQATAV